MTEYLCPDCEEIILDEKSFLDAEESFLSCHVCGGKYVWKKGSGGEAEVLQ